MDEFAQLSRENFEVFQRYGDAVEPDPRHRTITVHAPSSSAGDDDLGAPATYVEEDLRLDQLAQFFEPASSSGGVGSGNPPGAGGEGGAAPEASLKLVVIDSQLQSWSNFFPSLWTSKDVFLGLVGAMRMDPSALWLLRSEYDGFHHFPSSSSSPPEKKGTGEEEDDGFADTYYIGTSSFVLMWTFDARRTRTQTRALWILRQQAAFGAAGGGSATSAPAAWFANVLRRYGAHARSPLLPAYAAALSTCCTYDGEVPYHAHVVRLIERQTGYSTHSPGLEQRPGMQSLTVSIKEVGQVLNHNANKERHFRLMHAVLDFIVERAGTGCDADEEVASTRRLAAAIPLLRSRMHASQEYIKYLTERAERLSTVLFALLTHEDSATNAELADASRRIAEAAQRDSASMKTVAVMTMAFLPATFIAALFSVPSLDWRPDEPGGPVIRDNFWVYWAFALPATALVFGLWLLFEHGGHGQGGAFGGGGGGDVAGADIGAVEEEMAGRRSRDDLSRRSMGSKYE
ncbi:hypothetical protein GGR52DRAFT_211274 [Hypoxylon sp. FL1284]|nr:hypothetical protein GGR52DRAFT_211274 [Hypoxylon sp. FL1284]